MPLLTNQSSRFLGGGKLPAPVPTYGNNLIVNGTMETGSPPSNWTLVASATLASYAENRPGGSGSKSLELTRGTTDVSGVSDTVTGVSNQWYCATAWVKKLDGTKGWISFNGVNSATANDNITTNWAQQVRCGISTSTSHSIRLNQTGAQGTKSLFDDIEHRQVNLASAISARDNGMTHTSTKVRATIQQGSLCGVVCSLDSKTSPANMVVVLHNGYNVLYMFKCVAGTWTQLIYSNTVTYVANALIEVRRVSGTNTYQAYYNNAQVGTDQTIDDAGIISNTLHGMFNLWGSNILTQYSSLPST